MTTETVDPPVGEQVADVLRAAYYYALADGHPVVDPGQLLVAAARNDDQAGRILGRQVAEGRATTPRQDLPGPQDGAGLTGSRYAGALREARWWILRANPATDRKHEPTWSASIGAALARAVTSARAAEVTRLGMPHLLLGLLDPTEPTVLALSDRVGLDIAATRRHIGAAELSAEPTPFAPLVDPLRAFGAAQSSGPWPVRWIPALMARLTRRQTKWGGPVLACLEREVMRQAVVTGHGIVQSSSVLLAIVSMDVQLKAVGERLRKPYLPHNEGGKLLIEAGFDFAQAQSAAESLAEVERDALPVGESSSRFWDTGKPGDPSWSSVAARAMEQATTIAREHGHQAVGTSHLLRAVLAEDGAAAQLLIDAGIDIGALRRRVVQNVT
ncbi:Clp protease N-terminal domain-containing protein [Micromonospora marina]|uniref:Clp amino terminal domain-containing protein, pathogenicity island component n=1 Tax=Micromonospora marina TaxID=307120 RepID=A0A1C5AN86_9ACTN|nr:Clp protease N-terminal domain-containing protein [Micromonospora marina]SCF46596.1 Clp amino terminal domain-containing protein, pathogenicity island component [Micromonospora marina]